MNKKERLRELKRTVLNGISMEEMKQAKMHFEEHPGTLDLGEDKVSVNRRRIGRVGMLWMYYELGGDVIEEEDQTQKLKERLDNIPVGYWISAREGLQERHSGSLDGTEEEPISSTTRKLAEAVILWTYLKLMGHL